MDEPLSNLDAKLRVQTRAEIARLHQRLKTTIVYVTHDQVEAMTMGQRIAVMSQAKLQQVGSPQALYDHPNNKFVAGFIGSPAMNFLPVELSGSGESAVLVGDGIQVPLPVAFREAVGAAPGKRFIVGIRPEHIDVAPTGGDSATVPAGPTSSSTWATRSSSTSGSPGPTSWPSSPRTAASAPTTSSRSTSRSTRCTCSTPRRT